MPRLLFVNRFFHPDISATSQMLSDLAFELSARGMSVHVIASRMNYENTSERLAPSETINGVRVHRVLTTRFGRARSRTQVIDYLSFYLSGLYQLVRLVRRGDIVVIKTDPPLMSVPVVALSRLLGFRQINWLQDVFPEVAKAAGLQLHHPLLDRLFFRSLTRLRNRSLNLSDQTVVLGQRMLEYLLESGVHRDRMMIIPNWTETTTVIPVPAAQNPLRTQWGLQARFVVGYSGNMGLAHDFGIVLDAAQALLDREQFRFLMIGAGKRKAWLEKQVRDRGLVNTQFKPYQPRQNLAQSLSVADVHLVSLRPEMEGVVVPSKFYGVAAAGRPTIFIGDRDGEIARIIARHDCGVQIDSHDAAALVRALQRYADDPNLLGRHARNARHLAEQAFGLPQATDRWLRLLGGLQRDD